MNQEKVWIGFDLGGTKMLTIAYDDNWNVLGRRRRKTRGREGSDSGVERIGSTLVRLLSESGIAAAQIAGISLCGAARMCFLIAGSRGKPAATSSTTLV